MPYWSKQWIKNTASDLLSRTGSYRFLRGIYGGYGTLLGFHRVRSSSPWKQQSNRDLTITPELLHEIVLFFRSQQYEFISLTEAILRLKKPTRKKFVSLTFDDGYKEVAHEVYTYLKKERIPFTVYVTTGFADRSHLLWWYVLEDLLSLAASNVKRKFSIPETADAFTYISAKYFCDPHAILKGLVEVSSEMGRDPYSYCKNETLSWQELRELSKDPLVEIGSHSVSHLPLSKLSEEACRQELLGSKNRLQSELGMEVKHFCYPYGSLDTADVREAKLCKESGYESSVCTRVGNLLSVHRSQPYRLPRLTVGGDHETIRALEERHSGLPFVRNGPLSPFAAS